MIKKINLYKKIKFFLKKPKLVLLFGSDLDFIEKILLNIEKDIKIIDAANIKKEDLAFLLRNSISPVLVFKSDKDIPAYKIKTIISNLPPSGAVAFKKDNKFKENFKSKLSPTQVYSFAVNRKADIKLDDFHKNHGTTFKIEQKGNSVPFWVEDKLDKDIALDLLVAIASGIILGKNLVKISQILKEKH